MKETTYYGVITRYFGHGKVDARIISVTGGNIPDNTFGEYDDYDEYVDWFDDQEKAYEFYYEAVNSSWGGCS